MGLVKVASHLPMGLPIARLVGREVMPYVKAMATLERIMQEDVGCHENPGPERTDGWKLMVPLVG